MKVNPLMTVWLISCVITNSGLIGANRYSSFKYDKKSHRLSELARLYDQEDSLTSYKLKALRLLTAEKKKKHKTSTTELDPCAPSSSSTSTTAKDKKSSKTTTEATNNNDDACLSSLSSTTTAKNKKHTKKSKTRTTTSSQQECDGGDSKNSNANDNVINTGGSNKWKKIQKFFFGSPNWSFNKSYREYGPSTNEAKSREELKSMQLHQRPIEDTSVYMYEQTSITTDLHSIPDISNDQYKDKILVSEEVIKKNTPHEETINSKGPKNDEDTVNIVSKQQPNQVEKISTRIFDEDDLVNKGQVSQDEKFLPRNQEDGHDRVSSMIPMDITDERSPSMQINQQEAMIYRTWSPKQEEIITRQELSESDKMVFTEGTKLFSQDQSNEPEKEQMAPQENNPTNGLLYNCANMPSNNQIEPTGSINYNYKETLVTDFIPTSNTIGINGAIDERQLQLKLEAITDNIKEKYEVSIVKEDPELSSKPEATIKSESPSNETNMQKPDLSDQQNYGMKDDKWKHIFNFNEPDYEQLKHLSSNIINRHVTENDLTTSRIEKTFDKIINSNFNNIHNIGYENNLTDSSNAFLKAFSMYLRNSIPEMFTDHTVEKLYKTSMPSMYFTDNDNAYSQKVKQYFFTDSESDLPSEKNKYRQLQVNEEKYATLYLDSTFFVNLTNDNSQRMEPQMVTKDESLEKKLNESTSTTPSSTTMTQYSIDVWPKLTEYAYNINSNNINTQSPVHTSNTTPQLEIASSSNYPKEFNQTRAPDNGLTETTCGLNKTNESTELSKEPKAFETFLTIPLFFNDKDTEIDTLLSTNGITTLPSTAITTLSSTAKTTAKNKEQQSLLNLTLHPMLFSNLWGIQSYLNYSSSKPVPTTTNVFPDDKITFNNQHEFNSDHHFPSSTLQPFLGNAISSEWLPFNIPDLENEVDIINPSTFETNVVTQEDMKQRKVIKNINDLMSEILKENEIERNKKRNLTLFSRYFPFSNEINRRNLFLLNRGVGNPESVKKIHKYISHSKESANDPIWNEIMYRTKLRNEKIGSLNKDLRHSEKPYGRKQTYHSLRKPSCIEEKMRDDDNLINYIPLPKVTITNNGRDDIAEFLVKPLLKNIKKVELMAPKMNARNIDEEDIIKSGINKIATQVTNNDLKIRNNLNFFSNLNRPLSPETEELKELTHKYEQGKVAINDEFNRNGVSYSLSEFQRENVSNMNENKAVPLSIHNNVMLTKQSSASLLNDNEHVTSSNGWYVHNEQNEKLLASEKSFDRQLFMSSSIPVSFQKETKFDHQNNNIGFLNNTMNQSLPEITSNNDMNKNEYSAIQMSAIKIIKKKPEMLLPSIYDPFQNIFNQNDNDTEINREMSQMFMKMQSFANKLGIKKILLKRAVTDSQNNPTEINSARENKCSVLPTYQTGTLPLDANLTDSNIIMSPSMINSDKNLYNVTANNRLYISDKWKYNMQSLIDKHNENRNPHLNTDVGDVLKDSNILFSSSINNNEKPLEKYLGNQINKSYINSEYNYEKNDDPLFNNDIIKRNVVGNKKMKSRELEFILDRNLPRLPLNKRRFITYMMTGLKNSGNHITLDEERHSQLSKAYLQNLIDRNVKKDKVIDISNKRPRKKQWHNNSF